MNNWQAFGGELRRLRLQHDRSLRSLAKSIRYDVGALSRIENGVRRPPLRIVQDLDGELGAAGSLIRLAGECGAIAVDGIGAAATDSIAFADWATDDRSGQLSIDGLYYEISRIATSYVHSPPWPLFADLQLVRDQIWQLLRSGPAPDRARDLMFLGGVAMSLLAHISGNLGNPIAAMQHALAAERLAEHARHTALLSWLAGTKALIAEWSGNPSRAADFARAGSLIAPAGEQRVRLAALQARNAARLQRVPQAREAIRLAAVAAEEPGAPDDVTSLGGVLSFPVAKAAYYTGSTFRLIGDHAATERWSGDAIEAYVTGPGDERSYGDEALARIDIALARIGDDGLDGAREILAPVLELPAAQRIQPVVAGMNEIGARLGAAPYRHCPIALNLREEIASFRILEPPAS